MPTAAGDIITASDYAAEVAALDARVDALEAGVSAFTPTWRLGLNAVTLADGAVGGHYRVSGGAFHLYAILEFGSSTSWPVNDFLNLVLPFTIVSGTSPGLPVGGHLRLQDGATRRIAFPEISVEDNCVGAMFEDGTYVDGTTPFTAVSGSKYEFVLSGAAF